MTTETGRDIGMRAGPRPSAKPQYKAHGGVGGVKFRCQRARNCSLSRRGSMTRHMSYVRKGHDEQSPRQG